LSAIILANGLAHQTKKGTREHFYELLLIPLINVLITGPSTLFFTGLINLKRHPGFKNPENSLPPGFIVNDSTNYSEIPF
jgi:hypothetical protein